jgi:transcriptional repressor NrdR
MLCVYCGHDETRVVDSRLVGEGRQIRRRRVCQACEERFTTFETVELSLPHVIKGNGEREPFNEAKLRAGMMRALEKRPVSTELIEQTIGGLLHDLSLTGEREISSRLVGESVMAALRRLDKVAYIRFASVYLRFEDLEAFIAEIERLQAPEVPA